MAKKPDPFAELISTPRNVTPRVIRGEARKLWNELVERHAKGETDGMTYNQILEWCKKWLGLTCTIPCLRYHLDKDSKKWLVENGG